MTQQERDELNALLSPRKGEIDWLPLPGPQTKAFYCDANMLLYGGAAGGGKTDLLLGLAYYKHHRSAIFRREYTNLTGIMDRANEMFQPAGPTGEDTVAYGKYNGFFRRWSFYDRPGHILEYGAAENVGAEKKFQGRAHDAKLFDEGPQFTYGQFNYLRGWNRPISTSPKDQLLQTVVTCNPPQSSDERWINIPWANWLDRAKFPQGEVPGKLLWFITVDGNYLQVDGPGNWKRKLGWRQVEEKANGRDIHQAISITFIPSSLKDNPYLDDGQYASVLQSLPEPLRSQLLFGDFQAGVSDDPWQLFPTVWVEAAVARWKQEFQGKPPAGMFMSQLGVDVSRGGADRTVLTPRYGRYFDKQQVHKGLATKDGMKVAGLVIQVVKPNTVVVVDAIGIGSSPVDWLRSQDVKVVAFIASAGSENTDRSGYLHFKNKRADVMWRFREALDPQLNARLAIPDDPELIAELCAFTFKVTAGGIQVVENEEIVKQLGRSPDKAVSLILAGLPTHPVNFEEMSEVLTASVPQHRGSTGAPPSEADRGGFGVADSGDAPWNLG